MSTCKTVHLGVRVDNRISRAIEDEAKREKTTKTSVVEKMAKSYFTSGIPGMCSNCGHWNDEQNEFCGKCGKELKQ